MVYDAMSVGASGQEVFGPGSDKRAGDDESQGDEGETLPNVPGPVSNLPGGA